MFLCPLDGTPTLLLNPMDSQLEEVRHRIHKAEVEIVEVKQDLAIAKQAGSKGGEEEVRFLRGRLDKLDSQLLSLNEKENILLRSQAPSKPCLQLVHAGSDHVTLHSCNNLDEFYPLYPGTPGTSCIRRLACARELVLALA